jgi:hypothetical protein
MVSLFIPLVAYGVTAWTWPFVAFGYSLLWLRKQLSPFRLIIEVEDLPIERSRLSVSTEAPDLATCKWPSLNRRERLYTILESIIFRCADNLIQPSQPFSDHMSAKYRLPAARMELYRREIYMPSYNTPSQLDPLPGRGQLNLFYSAGSLTSQLQSSNLEAVSDVLADLPQTSLYLCGRDGNRLLERCRQCGQRNVYYLGLLSHAEHDAAARQCQIGLLLYAHSYADFKCTAKYSAYVANGLAVLSTDLLILSRIIKEDGVGQALPMPELIDELRRWATQPAIVNPYRQ